MNRALGAIARDQIMRAVALATLHKMQQSNEGVRPSIEWSSSVRQKGGHSTMLEWGPSAKRMNLDEMTPVGAR